MPKDFTVSLKIVVSGYNHNLKNRKVMNCDDFNINKHLLHEEYF